MLYGFTHVGNSKDVWLGKYPFLIGWWTVTATIVHEFAHLNGAPGGASKLAEQAVYWCELGGHHEHPGGTDDPDTPYNPDISG